MSLEIALGCIARGWYVLPIPRNGKKPIGGLAPRGFKSATNDEAVVRRWWTAKPDANVGVACGLSGLAVLDCDTGNDTEDDFRQWVADSGLPATLTVRSGRRPGFGTHSYFRVSSEIPTTAWSFFGRSGELRSRGAYVLAAGSSHKSGLPYEILVDAEIAEMPAEAMAFVRTVQRTAVAGDGDGSLDDLRMALETLGLPYEDHDEKLYVECPWRAEHSCNSGPSETALFIKRGLYCFKCHHSSCDGRGYAQYRAEVVK